MESCFLPTKNINLKFQDLQHPVATLVWDVLQIRSAPTQARHSVGGVGFFSCSVIRPVGPHHSNYTARFSVSLLPNEKQSIDRLECSPMFLIPFFFFMLALCSKCHRCILVLAIQSK